MATGAGKGTFEAWFSELTGHAAPHPWQQVLAAEPTCRDRLIRIPTGLGKTEGVLAAWSYHRVRRDDPGWPRRLVWCLPMRVLVEQTADIARRLADRMPEAQRPAVHVVMGGEDAGDWFLDPQRPAILVGTQDMLLSRALNRGYASPRARWPMEFGLLHQDALWVMDEVQLMDVGLATSAQLQAFRNQDRGKHLRPCHTWWMSATLQPDWLQSVDTQPHAESWMQHRCEVPTAFRTGRLWDVSKPVTTDTIAPGDHKKFAQSILEEHAALADGDFGRITLVVCNTVERACATFEALQKSRPQVELQLVHSRFRPAERERWREEFLDKKHCQAGVDRILVATQVVEAGVDISAGCLISELAPWPSLVQRFGRCARYGGSGKVLVVDRRKNRDDAAPYQPEELASAWNALQHLSDAGIAALETYEQSLEDEDRRRLYPYDPPHLLVRKEFDELFDTTPDLTGADLDISRFIRSGDERDLMLFWLEIPADKKGEPPYKPPEDYKPHRRELCAVPFLLARDWLFEKGKSALRKGKRAWVWDWIDGQWKVATPEALLPGRIVCVAADSGGYDPSRGFDIKATEKVPPVPALAQQTPTMGVADDQQNSEHLSSGVWKTIAWHSQEVADEVRQIADAISFPERHAERLADLLELAAWWHDWGKAHPAFQGSIRGADQQPRLARHDLAKAPKACWPAAARYKYPDDSDTRPAFRHELASALGLFALLQQYAPRHAALLGPWVETLKTLGQPLAAAEDPPAPDHPLIQRLLTCTAEEFDLVAYLVASHHGKVRLGLHAAPHDQDYHDQDGHGLPIRGIREGDRLPAVPLVPGQPALPEVTLSLEPAKLGLSPRTGRSWRERCIQLQERYGPCALALLEAILRAADVRASRRTTGDPTLAGLRASSASGGALAKEGTV
jgi:CRISPR-associated endonuclease/helicase Cas3